MSSRRDATLAHLLLLAVVALWGATFVLVKDALRQVTPLLFNQVRMTVAFLVLVLVYGKHLRRVSKKSLYAGAVAGLFLAAGYELQTSGLALTTPSKSAFLTGLVVVFVPLLSFFRLLRRPGTASPRAAAVLGAFVAFCGVLLLTLPPTITRTGLSRGVNRGDLLSLLCAVAFALHLLSLARSAGEISVPQIATLQIGFSALFMTVATPVLEAPSIHLTLSLLRALAVTAVFATAAAFSIQSWAQQHLKATHTALLLTLEPAFAWVTSLLLHRESFQWRSAAGAGLIFAGILATELLGSSSPTPVALEPEANQPGLGTEKRR